MHSLNPVQLHCPPEAVHHDDAVFGALDDLVADGRIAGYGASVKTCEKALAAIAGPGPTSVAAMYDRRIRPLVHDRW